MILYMRNRSLKNMKNKLGKIWLNKALVITGELKWSSKELLYNEPELEPLANRTWYRKLLFFL